MSAEAAALRQLAVHLRGVAARVEVRRATLGPAALTWWEGPGADAHRERMAVRRAALAAVADDLAQAAQEADDLAQAAQDADDLAARIARRGAPP